MMTTPRRSTLVFTAFLLTWADSLGGCSGGASANTNGSTGADDAGSGGGSTGADEGGTTAAEEGGEGGALACVPDEDDPPDAPDPDFPFELAGGLAPTPPMGWNSWNALGCSNITADVIEQMADVIVSTGMKDLGYEYVNIDDCWSEADRAADGSLQPTAGFPDGIKAVADYVHGKGLKLGIYGDRGTKTCAGRAGSEGHEVQDATTFASWGIDYLKYDNCSATLDMQTQYQTMSDALKNSGRDIVFSICSWEFDEWNLGVGHLWRTTGDITPDWDSIFKNIQTNRALAAYAGPNGWNDPDMLEVGNGSLPLSQYRAHFTMWAMMAAPLLAGNDLRHMTSGVKDVLTNKEVIEFDQDPLGIQGAPVWIQSDATGTDLEVWAKPLNESGARAVALLNAGTTTGDITVRFDQIGLGGCTATVRDVWKQMDLGTFTGSYTATGVPPQSVVALRIKGTEPRIPSGTPYLSDLRPTFAANNIGPVEKDMSNGGSAAGDGKPLTLHGKMYAKGLGVSAGSVVVYRLGRACKAFSADIGIDDETKGQGSVAFQVWGDGEKLFDTSSPSTPADAGAGWEAVDAAPDGGASGSRGVITASSAVQSIRVDVSGKRRLKLVVTNGGDGHGSGFYDRADWADAKLDCTP